tara:strand:+ start:97 stop:285 length:189 start_codon:yes stop_codon:yes gene_type:complete
MRMKISDRSRSLRRRTTSSYSYERGIPPRALEASREDFISIPTRVDGVYRSQNPWLARPRVL